jgi:uncharacterized protein (DUF58 family)
VIEHGKSLATPQLVLAAGATVLGFALALLVNDPAAATLVAPFALAVALVATSPAPSIDRVTIVADQDRLVVGGVLRVTTVVHGRGLAWVELRFSSSGHLHATTPDTVVVAPSTEVAIDYEARRWGGGTKVEVTVCGRGTLGLRTVHARMRLARPIRVYPAPQPMRELLAPRSLSGVGGAHPSRLPREGFEYAESRTFVPGDRLRDVNWRMSSRRGELWVDRRHPDLSGALVLFLDSFATSSEPRQEVLERAIEASTALARAHLRTHDRIGLVDLGGTLRWVPLGIGARHTHRVVETLVASEIIETWADKDLAVIPTFAFPPRSLVIALTPLTDPRSTRVLLQLRARHHDVAVIEWELPLPVAPPADRIESLGRRLWALEHEAVRSGLRRAGADVFVWRSGEPLEPVVRALRDERRRPHRMHA